MGFRVRPTEIDVPKDAPFENDHLDREGAAEALTNLVRTVDGPCVIAIDAAWGMGKTTFLHMWQADLLRRGLPAVMFNAWDTDFSNDPFLALSEEVQASLSEHPGLGKDTRERLKDAGIRILQNVGPALLRAAAAAAVGGAGAEVVDGILKAFSPESPSRYREAKDAMDEFREALEAAARELAEGDGALLPLVVIIDELDRCRPSYAVELLEVLKHLFTVDGVVFVLAVNRAQLGKSVRVLYGADFDAAIYLRRFIDIDILLPHADRQRFIDTQLDEIFSQLRDVLGEVAEKRRIDGLAMDWLRTLFEDSGTDLRTVQQALRRLGLMLAMAGDEHDAQVLTATFALILLTLEPELYARFIRGDAGDDEVATALFERTGTAYRYGKTGYNLEAEIIGAVLERQDFRRQPDLPGNSQLLAQYETQVRKPRGLGSSHSPEHNHAQTMLGIVSDVWANPQGRSRAQWFQLSVTRLALVSEPPPDRYA